MNDFATDPLRRDTDEISETRRFLAFVVVLVTVVLEVADSTIVNTALPAIRDALGATSTEMQWIVAGYLLALGALLLLGGKLGDALGHSRVFLFGMGAFVLASALCGLARDATELVIARLLQGAAGAIMGPQGMAVVQLLYTPLERVSRLAYFGLIVGLAAIIGPIVGGMLIELDLFGLGWRVIFLINLPIGLCAIALGWFVLPAAEKQSGLQIDPVGAAVFAAACGGLLYAFVEGADEGWRAELVALGIASSVLIAFGWHRAKRRRSREMPSIIDPALFDIPTFRWAMAAAFAFSAASIGFLLVFAVSLQQGLGLTPLDTALVHVPFGIGVMLGVGLIVPRFLPRFGKGLPFIGGQVMIIGCIAVLLLIAAGHGGGHWLLGSLAIAGLGMGVLSGPLGPIVVADVPKSHAGSASASFRMAQQVGGAFGIALVGSAYFSFSARSGAALDGLVPAACVTSALLALSVIFVSRLPKWLFNSGD